MLAFLGIGPIGGLIAMITSVWHVFRVRRGRAPLGLVLGRVAVVLVVIAGLAGGAIAVRLATVDTYGNEPAPTLEFEIRLPEAMAVGDRAQVSIELHTDRNVADSVF